MWASRVQVGCSCSALVPDHHRDLRPILPVVKGSQTIVPRPVRMSGLRFVHANRHILRHRALGLPRNVSTSARQANPVRTGLYATVFVVSTGLFAAYYFDSRSAIHRYVFNPVLRYTLDPEEGHKFAVKVLSSGFAPKDTQKDDEVLGLQVCCC